MYLYLVAASFANISRNDRQSKDFIHVVADIGAEMLRFLRTL